MKEDFGEELQTRRKPRRTQHILSFPASSIDPLHLLHIDRTEPMRPGAFRAQ